MYMQESSNIPAAGRELSDRNTPFVLVVGDLIHIVVNKKILFQVQTCCEAVLMLLACYYIFNLSYSPRVLPSLLFLQSAVLNQPIESTPKVDNFITFINSKK